MPKPLRRDLAIKHFRRRDGLDRGETREIRLVEAEKIGLPVPLHGGNQTRIVGVLPLHIVCGDQIAPVREHAAFVEQQAKERDPLRNRRIRIGDRHTEAVILRRAGGDDPILVEHLRNDDAFMPFASSQSIAASA